LLGTVAAAEEKVQAGHLLVGLVAHIQVMAAATAATAATEIPHKVAAEVLAGTLVTVVLGKALTQAVKVLRDQVVLAVAVLAVKVAAVSVYKVKVLAVAHLLTQKVRVKAALVALQLRVVSAEHTEVVALLVKRMEQLARSGLYTPGLYANSQAQERRMNNGTTVYKGRRE
jgi:hypothetical protein